LSLLATLALGACGSDSTEPFVPVIAPQISNGGTQATSTTYWQGNFSTSGAYLLLQLFGDGTGRLSYHNDSFQPPTGLTTRNLYDFTWTETENGSIALSYAGVSATFSGFDDIVSETSFDVVFSDGTNVNEDFTFISFPLPGGVGTDPPL
jgi:hypothetical protein